MSILDLAKLFTNLTGQKIYAINFPAYKETMKDETFVKLEITSGIEEVGDVEEFNIQLIVKSKHPSSAEEVSLIILEKLDMLTNQEFAEGQYQLILSKASSPQPYYMGQSEENDSVFSVDFRLMVTRI